MSFDSLGLSEAILRAVKEQGYTVPTPIQLQAIPAILAGRDVLAAAQTGTGKTAGFTLPILQLLSSKEVQGKHTVRTLVLTPTRELAAQVADDVRDYGRHLGLRSAVVFGGVGLQPQLQALRRGVDILIATPGRLLDLHNQGAIDFSALEILVLDEADRMLDMGFINDIRKIMGLLPHKRQNLLFSATFSPEIRRMAEGLLHDPQTIEVAPRNTAAESVEQWVHLVDKSRKSDLLCHLIKEQAWPQVLVFTRTKHGANRLSEKLERAGISSAAIHGNKSQAARTRALHDFKQGEVRVLVATDIAARGLDIEQLPQVVNFELPNVPEDYVHRIGRTGRAGASGSALSLVSADERSMLHGIERLLRKKLRSEVVPGFEPGTGSAVDVEDVRPPRQPRGQPRSAGAGRPAHSQPRSNSNSDPARSRHGSGGQPRSNDGARPARTGDSRSNGGGRSSQPRRSSAPAYVGIYDSTRHGLHDTPPRGDVDGNRITSPGNTEVQRGQAPHLSSHEQPRGGREGQGRPRGSHGGGAGRGGNPSRSGSGGRPAHARSSQPRQRPASDAYNDRDGGGSSAPTPPKKPIIIVKTW